jgi:tetratricopeptide (TPR) repeat protein
LFSHKTLSRRLALATSALAPLGVLFHTPANAQIVADRALSDVRVDNVGGCAILTVNFNVRVQFLSHFPDSAGRELHIRVRPLDGSALGRESLRTPTSVPSLRSLEYEGDNSAGPVLSLFFTRDMRFEVEAGARPQSIVIRIAEPGAGPLCVPQPGASATVPQPVQPGQPAPLPDIAIPAGLYVVNLMSIANAPGTLGDAQKKALDGLIVYETTFERDSQTWHRLRAGFFESREEANAAQAKLEALFPGAWVIKVSADERAQGVASRMPLGSVTPAGSQPVQMEATPEQAANTAKLIGDAEAAIKAGEIDRAVQLLTNAAGQPENPNSPRARELLGVTRERKGQVAQARAEYEEYLRRYPSGDGAERVRQRLAALGAAGQGGGTQLRQVSGRAANAWSWGARGSFSQFYFRDQSTTKFIDASRVDPTAEVDNNVNLNQLLSTADLTLSGGDDRIQLQFRGAGSYAKDFRPNGRDIKAVTALYLDYADSVFNTDWRVGRQTRNSAGVLGRFDGSYFGWQFRPKIRINAVAGFPVLTSRQTYVLRERFFYGISADFGSKGDRWQNTLYWFDQRARGGFIDRRSVGLESRYFTPRFNAYLIADYDIKYRALNLGLFTLNYNFPDNSNFSLTADYRQSPLLTTNNALIGQFDPNTLLPITDLRGLRPFFTDAQIYGLARDRTLVTKSMTASYSRPLGKKLQANLDFTWTNTGGTPASGGVDALPKVGSEYYYGLQFVGTGLLWSNDIYIFGGRYADTQRSRTATFDINARVPVTNKFRLSPRLRYGSRKDKLTDGSFSQFQPTLRINYYPVRHSEIEIELGGNFTHQNSVIMGSTTSTTETGYVLTAGYRLDF